MPIPQMIDFGNMSDDQFRQFQNASAPTSAVTAAPTESDVPSQITPTAAPANSPPSGVIDFGKMSDEDFAKLHQQKAQASPMGAAEAAGRLYWHHLTLGTDIGADKQLAEEAAEQHPYINLATGAGAMFTQVPVIGQIATALKAVRAVNAAGKIARGAGNALEFTLLPNKEAAGYLATGRTAGKLAGIYSGLETAGEGITNPNKTWGDVAKETAGNTLLGMGMGSVLGVGAHGISQLAGKVATSAFPALPEILEEAAANPSNAGARVLFKHGALDNYTLEDLQNKIADIAANPERYKGKNLIEALETGPLVEQPPVRPGEPGELMAPVIESPNLRNFAREMAETQGTGRTEAVEANTRRNNEMSGLIGQEVESGFPASRAPAGDVESMKDMVTKGLKVTPAEDEQTLREASQAAFAKRYGKIAAEGPQYQTLISRLARMAADVPELGAAVSAAAKNDIIRGIGVPTGEGVIDPVTNTFKMGYQKPWTVADLAKGLFGHVLSADNILDIHSQLAKLARTAYEGNDPNASAYAGNLKNWFSKWVDDMFQGHEDLRNQYAIFKKSLAATEQGKGLTMTGGGNDHDSLKFLRDSIAQRDKSQAAIDAMQARHDAAQADYAAGRRPNPPNINNRGDKKFGSYPRTVEANELHNRVIDRWRSAWARKNFLDPLDAATTQEQRDNIVRSALTPTGLNRIKLAMGEREAQPFIDQLHEMEARRQGANLSLGSTIGPKDREALTFLENHPEAKDSFVRGWGDRIQDELTRRRSEGQGAKPVLSSLLTAEGKKRILKLLGPDVGKQWIASLYDKMHQLGYNQTLYGGPDTAYKYARLEANRSLINILSQFKHMRPWNFHPMEMVRGLGEIASLNYAQKRADQVNHLLSRMGPEEVTNALQSIIGAERARTIAAPYVRNPLTRLTGPLGTTVPSAIGAALAPDQNRGKRAGESQGGWVWRPYQGKKP